MRRRVAYGNESKRCGLKRNFGMWSVRRGLPLPMLLSLYNSLKKFLRHCISPMARPLQCTRSSRALRSVFVPSRNHEITLPTFLVPAFALQTPANTPHFSTSSRCQSKIGRAPISLPPEVTFRILEAPTPKSGRNVSRTEPSRTVEIQGPLGMMKMTIPPYIGIESSDESGTHTLSILDAEDKKQKAMWGVYNHETR